MAFKQSQRSEWNRNNNRRRNILNMKATRGQVPKLASTRCGGSNDPPPVARDIVLTTKRRIALPTGSTAITPIILATALPGGSDLWNYVRVVKVSAYGNSTTGGNVVITNMLPDFANFDDEGVAGATRPAIHIKPALSLSQQWYATTSTTTLFIVSYPTTQTGLLDITLEIRSNSQEAPSYSQGIPSPSSSGVL